MNLILNNFSGSSRMTFAGSGKRPFRYSFLVNEFEGFEPVREVAVLAVFHSFTHLSAMATTQSDVPCMCTSEPIVQLIDVTI